MTTTTHRPEGLFARVSNLLQGWTAAWVRDREGRSPRAVYEQAIRQRTRQYAELKQAVAGVLYMRNKIDAEIRERREHLAELHLDIERCVRRGNDDAALALIAKRDRAAEDLQRAENELDEIVAEAEQAKGNLANFRAEIQSLEREKVRMLAMLANARARRRVQEALDGLSLDTEMKALDNVREQIARLRTEGNLERELADDALHTRLRAVRQDARLEGARRELAEIKARLAPPVASGAAAPTAADSVDAVAS
jgi:phage shock protein A